MSEDDTAGRLVGAIFATSPDAIVVIDETETIILSSPSVTTLFGYYPEELVGEPLSILIPPDRRSRHESHVANFMTSPHPRQMGAGLELAGHHRDGTAIPVDVSLAPVTVREKVYVAAFVRDASERQRNMNRLHAVHEITERLLAGSSSEEIKALVARRARSLANADTAWVVSPEDDVLVITAADGAGAETLLGTELSLASSRSSQVMQNGKPEVVDDLSSDPSIIDAVRSLGFGSGLYVPMMVEDRCMGLLCLTRLAGKPPFLPHDVALAEVFAASTATGLELDLARSEVAHLDVVAEDERIARDLHDTTIQQLFAIGMSLQAGRSSMSGTGAEKIETAITALDDVIRGIRTTIFRLPGRTEEARGLRDEMLALADRYAPELGFTPRVEFHGPVDSAVPASSSEQLLAVLSEALSNVARHAHASAVEAVVDIDNHQLTLAVSDDGVGISEGLHAGNGLRNMAARANEVGGSFEIVARIPKGTVLEWKIPLDS